VPGRCASGTAGEIPPVERRPADRRPADDRPAADRRRLRTATALRIADRRRPAAEGPRVGECVLWAVSARGTGTMSRWWAARTDRWWCSLTGSAAIRTCGAWSRRGWPATSAWCWSW